MTAPQAPARPGLHVLAKPIGSVCDIACDYCFYLEKEKLLGVGVMSDEVLEAYVRQRFQFADDSHLCVGRVAFGRYTCCSTPMRQEP